MQLEPIKGAEQPPSFRHEEYWLSVGYARLAEMLGLGIRPGDPPLDRAQALALLEQALAWPVDDKADWDLETRRDDLRRITVDEPPDAT